jgi:hypothetical protein
MNKGEGYDDENTDGDDGGDNNNNNNGDEDRSRINRRRQNLGVYKIQGASTISMLRLLLYW